MTFTAEYFRSRYQDRRFGISAERRRAYLYASFARLLRRACPAPRVIVEVGCGVGYLSKHLARLGPLRLVGLDAAPEALALARANLAGHANAHLVRADAQRLPVAAGGADAVVAIDVIEHLAEPEQFIAEAARVLRRNGVVLISTPNPGSVGARLKGHYPEWRGRPLEERQWQWFGCRDDSHVSIRPIEAWRQAFARQGFERVRDGTDFLWDTPYVRGIPPLAQKLVMGGLARLLTIAFGILPWRQGENYLAVFRRRASPEHHAAGVS